MDEIRVCVTQPPDYRIVMTWYQTGAVWCFDRETGEREYITTVKTLDDLNLILYEYEITPVGFGRKGKKQERQEELRQYARLPF